MISASLRADFSRIIFPFSSRRGMSTVFHANYVSLGLPVPRDTLPLVLPDILGVPHNGVLIITE